QRRAGAHRERLAVDEVGPTEAQARAPRGRVLQAVQGDVEIATLERGHQVRPVILMKLGAHAELSRERFGDLHFEADDRAWLRGALVHVGLAALEIRAPAELAAGLYGSPISARKRRRQCRKCKAKNSPDAHAKPSLP